MRPAREKIRLVALIGELGRGGSERQLYLLLSHLDPARFERHVVVFNAGRHAGYDEALRANGVNVIPVPVNCRGIRRRLGFVVARLREIKADIVHSWTVHDNPYAGIGGRLARVPVRWGSLRGSLASPGFQGLPALYRHLALRSVSHMVVNSAGLEEQLVAQGYSRGRVIALPNCVALETPPSIPDLSELGVAPDHRLVGIVGNLRRVKNHRMFIEGMARVLPDRRDVCAIVVGQAIPAEPDLPGQLQHRIAELGLAGRIIMAGFRPDVPELMHRLALLCLTSDSEGVPNVLLEAMAAGRPVVATRVGGVPDIVEDGIHGLLVSPGDVESFAGAVGGLLDDRARAERLGANGHAHVARHFSPEGIAARLGELYARARAEA